jgi:hypothetical protein
MEEQHSDGMIGSEHLVIVHRVVVFDKNEYRVHSFDHRSLVHIDIGRTNHFEDIGHHWDMVGMHTHFLMGPVLEKTKKYVLRKIRGFDKMKKLKSDQC